MNRYGTLQFRVAYDAYGTARHSWARDIDGDGDVDAADGSAASAASGKRIHQTGYSADADWDRNGQVNSTDVAAFGSGYYAAVLPAGALAENASDFNVGFCGYRFNGENGAYTVRFRHYDPTPGVARWLERDPAGYADGPSLYAYLGRSPLQGQDAFGLFLTSATGRAENVVTIADIALEAQGMHAGQRAAWLVARFGVGAAEAIAEVTGLSVESVVALVATGATSSAAVNATAVAQQLTSPTGPDPASASSAGSNSGGNNGSTGGSNNVGGGADQPDPSNYDPNKYHHIFGDPDHNLQSLVDELGSEAEVLRVVQEAANQALRDGLLNPGPTMSCLAMAMV